MGKVVDDLGAAVRWAIDGNHCGLKQIDAMIAAGRRLEALEAALDKIAMTEFSDAWVDQQASMAWAHCCFMARTALESS